MAERNTAEELDDVYEIKYSTDAMTGGADKRMYLYYQLADSIKKADSVDIIVSFLMESGVKMLLGELDNALKYSLQGTTQGRYLTGGVPPVRFSM